MMHHVVYVIEIGRTSAGQVILYVGSTGLPPAERMAQHRRGYKANRQVQKAASATLRMDLATPGQHDPRKAQQLERELFHRLNTDPQFVVYGN